MKIYINRKIEDELIRESKEFPVLILTGARQTGKSTLLKYLFSDYTYVTLDYPNIRKIAIDDPELFLESYGKKLIIDKIQYAPELLDYIKIKVDEERNLNGQYILTGSQYFPLMKGISESLAGRASINNLLGLSVEELNDDISKIEYSNVFDLIFNGFYPDVAIHNVRQSSFYASYLQTYLERDIRSLLAVHNLSLFNNFIELLAARVGSILNLNEIANECGISFTTSKKWLSLLESTQIIYLLRPYSKNVTKRVVKSPKLYFYDTGLLSYILHYQTAETLQFGPLKGNFFENFIIIEILKKRYNYNLNFELYFYRDSNKNEVDLVIERDSCNYLVEIKAAKTLHPKFTKTIERISKEFQNPRLFILSFDDKNIPISKNVKPLPWYDLENIVKNGILH